MNVKGQAAEVILAQLGPGREQGEKTVMSLLHASAGIIPFLFSLLCSGLTFSAFTNT